MKRIQLPAISVFAVLLSVMVPLMGQTSVLNFDDGTDETPIDGFYACRGVLFSNAFWFPNESCNTHQPFEGASAGPFAINRLPASSNGRCPQVVYPSSPIIATFGGPVTNVTITALDVGNAGARLDAYDAVEAGNLVATAEVYGGSIGITDYFVLTNSAASIRRVEFYQPAPNGSDGIVFDTLTFSPSPAPACLGLTRTNEQTLLRLTGTAGSRYVIQAADTLSAGISWTDLITNTASGEGFFDFVDTQATNAARFYRSRVQ